MVWLRGVRGCRNGRVTAFVERLGEGERRRRPVATSGPARLPLAASTIGGRATRTRTASAPRRPVWPNVTPGSLVPATPSSPVWTCSPRWSPGVRPERNDLLWRLALRRMERCVQPGRPGVHVGGPRVAVVLATAPTDVAPSTLGRRLAHRHRRPPRGRGHGSRPACRHRRRSRCEAMWSPRALAATTLKFGTPPAPPRVGTNSHAGPNAFTHRHPRPRPPGPIVSPALAPPVGSRNRAPPVGTTRLSGHSASTAGSWSRLSDDLLHHPAETIAPNGGQASTTRWVGVPWRERGYTCSSSTPKPTADHNPRAMVEAVATVARQCGALPGPLPRPRHRLGSARPLSLQA